MAPCSARRRASASCSAAVRSLSLCRSPRVAFDARAPEQVGRSPARSRNARISNAPQELLVFLLRTFFFPCPFPAPQALKIWPRPPGPRYCVYCTRTRTLGRVPGGTCRPAGAVPQAPSARRRREIFRGGAGGGRFGGQIGGQGRKMAICATLCYTEISSRRVDRVLCWGVNSAVFGVQWGACRLPEPLVLAVVEPVTAQI